MLPSGALLNSRPDRLSKPQLRLATHIFMATKQIIAIYYCVAVRFPLSGRSTNQNHWMVINKLTAKLTDV